MLNSKFWLFFAVSTQCDHQYELTLGVLGTTFASEAAGIYNEIGQNFDNVPIYQKENSSLLLYLSTDGANFALWLISNKIPATPLLFTSVDINDPGCPGPENSKVWFVLAVRNLSISELYSPNWIFFKILNATIYCTFIW